MTLILNNDEIEQVLSMEDALEAMEIAFRDLAEGKAINRPRSHSYTPLSDDRFYCFKSMDGSLPRLGVHALRLTSDIVRTVFVDGKKREEKLQASPGSKWLGLVLLFSLETIELMAIMQDGYLQRMRVGATSGLAAKYLSREDSQVAGMFGSGGQAGPQLMALQAVRPIRLVKVFSPTRENRERFASQWSDRLGLEVRATDEPREIVQGSDIVIAATNSLDPVFSGEWLEEGQHVNSLQAGELDEITMERAAVVAVRSMDQSTFWCAGNQIPGHMAACGQYDLAIKPKLQSLGAILLGQAPGRNDPKQITLFGGSGTGPSSGLGIQFAAVGAKIYQRAREQGLGQEVPTAWFLERLKP